MSMIFQTRMLCAEDENFIRDYELSYSTTLLELHRFICADLGFDPQVMASFFLSNKAWEKLQEFTLVDMGQDDMMYGPIPMEIVPLGQTLHQNNDRLIYQFDVFNDRTLFIELMGAIKKHPELTYPRITVSQGVPPPQFGLEEEKGETIFSEVMEDFFQFEGNDFYDDEF